MIGNPSIDESRMPKLESQFLRVEDAVTKGIRLQRSRHYNEIDERMGTTTIDSVSIFMGREEDRRWRADIESMPGVRESAIAAARAFAQRVAAGCIEHCTDGAKPFQIHSHTSDLAVALPLVSCGGSCEEQG